MTITLPRSVRNNNPGNINGGNPWRGLMPKDQMNPDQKAETRFAVFQTPAWGFRALAITLLNYQVLYHLKTIGEIIARWAPSSENNTAAYQNVVAKFDGVGVSDPIQLSTNRPLLEKTCKAIAIHEAGYWPDGWDTALDSALNMIGV